MMDIKSNPTYTLTLLNSYQRYLSIQEYRTIKGQITAGDNDGARKGLLRLLKKRGVEGVE